MPNLGLSKSQAYKSFENVNKIIIKKSVIYALSSVATSSIQYGTAYLVDNVLVW